MRKRSLSCGEYGAIDSSRDLARVVNEVSDEVVGLGPIEFLLRDPPVTEVMVNGPDDVYVERKGPTEMLVGVQALTPERGRRILLLCVVGCSRSLARS